MPNKKVSQLAVLFVVGLGVVAATASAAPSFDCSKASTKVEKMICDDSQLADADAKLSDAYSAALKTATDKVEVKHKQIAWVKQRNACSDVVCVQQAYDQRLEELHPDASSEGDDSQAAVNVQETKTESELTEPSQVSEAANNSQIVAAKSVIKVDESKAETSAGNNLPPSTVGSGKPDAGFFSKLAGIVFSVFTIVFLIGLLRPSWILFWLEKALLHKSGLAPVR